MEEGTDREWTSLDGNGQAETNGAGGFGMDILYHFLSTNIGLQEIPGGNGIRFTRGLLSLEPMDFEPIRTKLQLELERP